MRMPFDFSFFLSELKAAFTYIPITMLLSFVPLLGGLLLGALMALSRIYQIRILKNISQAYVVAVRSIPIILQMLLIFYGVKAFHAFLGNDKAQVNAMGVALAALTLNAASGLSEGLRSALLSVEAGQHEAAYSVGMTRLESLRYVVIPQCLPVAIPLIGSSFIGIIKGSSAAFLLGVLELLQGVTKFTAGNYKYLEAYWAAAVVYWLLTILVERVTALLEALVRRHAKGGVSA